MINYRLDHNRFKNQNFYNFKNLFTFSYFRVLTIQNSYKLAMYSIILIFFVSNTNLIIDKCIIFRFKNIFCRQFKSFLNILYFLKFVLS